MDSNNTDGETDGAIEPANRSDVPSEPTTASVGDGHDPGSETVDTGYVSLDLEDGEVVIYDPDDHRAWIQSDFAVEINGPF